MFNMRGSSTPSGAGPDVATTRTRAKQATAHRNEIDAEIAHYAPPKPAIHQNPDASAETRRQFTAWG
jgi:hypothetical protein